MSDLLQWLQNVFAEDFCDGDWEHSHTISIITLDNPGWNFKFDLRDTDIESFPFEEVLEYKDEGNWFHCKIENGMFDGWGGPNNLSDIIRIFQDWYFAASRWADAQRKNV